MMFSCLSCIIFLFPSMIRSLTDLWSWRILLVLMLQTFLWCLWGREKVGGRREGYLSPRNLNNLYMLRRKQRNKREKIIEQSSWTGCRRRLSVLHVFIAIAHILLPSLLYFTSSLISPTFLPLSSCETSCRCRFLLISRQSSHSRSSCCIESSKYLFLLLHSSCFTVSLFLSLIPGPKHYDM